MADGGSEGKYIIEPVVDKEVLLTATLDYNRVLLERQNFDLMGYYSHADVFRMTFNPARQAMVRQAKLWVILVAIQNPQFKSKSNLSFYFFLFFLFSSLKRKSSFVLVCYDCVSVVDFLAFSFSSFLEQKKSFSSFFFSFCKPSSPESVKTQGRHGVNC